MTTEEQHRPETNNVEVDREMAADFARAFAGGKTMAEIFDVPELYVDMVEHRAYVLYSQGQYETAELLIKGVRSLDHKRYYPHVLLGDIYLRQDRLEDADEALRQAYALRPDDPCIIAKLGELNVRRGRKDEGQELLQKVVNLVEDADNPHRRRAQVLLTILGREQGAAVPA